MGTNDRESIKNMLERAEKGKGLSKEEALTLLYSISNSGEQFESLLSAADRLSRKQFGNKGEVHA